MDKLNSGKLLLRAAGVAMLGFGMPLALGLPAAPALAAPGSQAPSRDLDRAVRALRAIDSMQADFTQVSRGGQRVGGTMTLKRPGKIRFQYERGVPLLIVSDGTRLTMLDYEVSQKQVWPVKSSPLGALLDPGKDVTRFGTLVSSSAPDTISILVKDPAHPEYGRLTLHFRSKPSAPSGLELAGWNSVDSQNNLTRIILNNHRYGMPISDNMFRYKDVSSPTRRGPR
ncbi:outer membrane lipoprotein carrier protein LolA [Croceicoccus sp. F390]|uniref:Outer membrane lipoprotein carrier protein LolA n=1 Tax=Croceicoccus esteveae TaxID=3075597 RepID=A0ABU2ZKF4_9SPHN|nr:outer membrane lipoprotein carrier protein LolA [Croceicoccus sp. F390]MDT0576855.1 outer membrane lipoprotein carrier protein LolA [Croceicoccus sp. F390]